MKLPRTSSLPAEVPTSSMADIAFLLIVFFMLTTVFSSNAGMTHILPKSDETGTPEEAIFITVHPSGDFAMDGSSYPAGQATAVFDYVSSKIQLNANKPIILYTNPEAPYGSMVAILDQLKLVEKRLDLSLAITIPSKAEAKLILASL